MEIAISDTKTSYEIGVELLSICREQNDKHGMAKAYLLLSYSGQFLGFYAQSYEYINLSIPLFNKYKDLKNLASAYNTLGFIFYYFDDHENRLEVNLKSLELSRSLGDEKACLKSLNNTGDTYLQPREKSAGTCQSSGKSPVCSTPRLRHRGRSRAPRCIFLSFSHRKLSGQVLMAWTSHGTWFL